MLIKLSIIIPVYNVELYIRDCLESIFSNGNLGLPYEVIVVDDGTPDNSMSIVEEYSAHHSNLKIIHQSNQGQGVARNTGLSAAKGDYVWFVDSDDWIESIAIEEISRHIDSYPQIQLFAIPATWVYADRSLDFVDLTAHSDEIISYRLYTERYGRAAAWQFVFKRNLAIEKQIRFYPGIKYEDGIWCFEMQYLAGQLMVLSTPLYNYRQNNMTSAMHNISIQHGYDLITIHKLLMDFMDKYVAEVDKVWFKKNHIFRIQGATYVVWHLRHTPEFKKFISDTKDYRNRVCNDCAHLGNLYWTLKCCMMKYPVLNEYMRRMKKRLMS